jgi:hypothetical protein
MTFLRSFVARTAVGSALVLLSPFAASVARAQDDTSAAETAAARQLAIEGLKLAQSGNCSEAVDKLARSEKLRHSAIVLGRLGECLVNLGKLVEGTEALRRMLREPLPAEPTPALQQAYERAQATLDAAKPRLAALTINIDAPPEAKLAVTIDGEAVPTAMVGVESPADPGEHVIEVTAPGFLKASTRVRVGAGEKQAVALQLERDPNAPPPGAESSTEAGAATPNHDPGSASSSGGSASQSTDFDSGAPPESTSRAPAYIAYGVGAVGLGVGLGFGLAAMQGKSGLDDKCQNDVCPPDQQDSLDSAKLKGTISTIGFAVGGVGIALGTILFVTSGPSSSEAAKAPGARRVARTEPAFRARAAIGLGHVQAALDF